MPVKKKYIWHICKDCELEFLTPDMKRKPSCPNCGDSIHVDELREIWMERGISYKRPWTKEDDDLLLLSIKEGYGRQDIADELGRTRKAVNRRYSELTKVVTQ